LRLARPRRGSHPRRRRGADRSRQPRGARRARGAGGDRAMTRAEATADRYGAAAHGHAPAEGAALMAERIVVGHGFWIFLPSDIILFSAFFATYAVLADQTAGGPSGRELFDLPNVAVETACLLLSSFTCGMASIGAQLRRRLWFQGAMAATFVLGAIF